MNREKQRLGQGLARARGIDLRADFHTLPISQKTELGEVARLIGYRDPKSPSGRSRVYSFFLYLSKGLSA